MTVPSAPELGYSILREGAGQRQQICIVAPHIARPISIELARLERRVTIKFAGGAATLPDIPVDVVERIVGEPESVMLVTTDCLSVIRSCAYAEVLLCGRDPDMGPGSYTFQFNEFLTRAANSGDLSVLHRRVLARQPENEIFVRKALVAMHRLAPKVTATTGYVEMVAGHARHGRANLASIVERHLKGASVLTSYTSEPRTDMRLPLPDMPPVALFTLLHSYGYCQLSSGGGSAGGLGLAGASLGMGLSGTGAELSPAIREAADSVFSQTFSDAYAALLIAAFHGNGAALDVLSDVMRRRSAAGDFGTFSLAPLSQDTEAGLEIARHELRSGKNFASMSKHELLGHAAWLASESLGAWMQKHDVGTRSAAGVAFATEAATQMFAASAIAAKESRAH